MLNSCSKFTTVFLLFVQLTVQGLSFWLSLKFLKLINILVHIPIVSFFLNATGQTTICLVTKALLVKLKSVFVYVTYMDLIADHFYFFTSAMFSRADDLFQQEKATSSWSFLVTQNSILHNVYVVKIGVKIATHLSAYAPCARYIFFDQKNKATLSELILQMVTYFHAGNHVKPQRVKTRI